MGNFFISPDKETNNQDTSLSFVCNIKRAESLIQSIDLFFGTSGGWKNSGLKCVAILFSKPASPKLSWQNLKYLENLRKVERSWEKLWKVEKSLEMLKSVGKCLKTLRKVENSWEKFNRVD